MTTLPVTAALILEREDGVLRIWFNRPEARNALTAEITGELSAVLDAVRDDRSIRTLVLRGKGGVFCAGGDIKGFRSGMQGSGDATAIARSNRSFGDLMIKLNEQPQVVVMLVEGGAVGGGFGLACVGDVSIIEKETRFQMSETSLGIPPAQIAPFVVERVGLTQARRLMLTGARFKGEEAVRLGIGHFLADGAEDVDRLCNEVLTQIANCAPGANAITKAILFEATRRSRTDALDFAAEGFARCILSDEGREGVAAFIEKRKARWAVPGDNTR
jgi:isohexenylglutaconyl-CoA hydratase